MLLLARVLLLDRLGLLLLIILTRISVSLLGGVTCTTIILTPCVLHQKRIKSVMG